MGAGIREALPRLKEAFELRGRNAGAMHIVPMGVLPDAAKLDYYREIGATEAVLRLPSAGRDGRDVGPGRIRPTPRFVSVCREIRFPSPANLDDPTR